jgi:glycosyltransferase involved in cell wall biosynthesis
MRILIDAKFITHPQVGGFKTYVECLVKGLEAAGEQDQYILCVDRVPAPSDLPIQDRGFRVVVGESHVPMLRAIVREQIHLRRLAEKERVDLVHFTCNTGSLFIAQRYVLTLHDVLALNNPYFRFGRPLATSAWAYVQARYQSLVIPRVARQAAAIITVSEYEKGLIVERLGIPPDRVHVTYLAPSSIFACAQRETREKMKREIRLKYGIQRGYILSVGSKPSKNVPGLVRAYASVRSCLQEPPDLVLVVPHSVTEQEIVRTAAALGVAEHVRVIPGIPQSELAALYNLADVFAFPSFRESFGLPPLEAMACGTPVVVANSSCLPEVVGDAAVLVDPHDVSSIADGILAVLTNEGLCCELREKGLRRASEFSWERTARETVAVYQWAMDHHDVAT